MLQTDVGLPRALGCLVRGGSAESLVAGGNRKEGSCSEIRDVRGGRDPSFMLHARQQFALESSTPLQVKN
jgi:hypothetical protein